MRRIFRRPSGPIPLHEPRFDGREREYVLDAIDSSYVSSVGRYVDRFEQELGSLTGGYAVATANGTAALHAALVLVGVERDTEVLTQALTFVATANAVRYCGADPVFIDVDESSLGMAVPALRRFLDEQCFVDGLGRCINRHTRRRIAACVPVHIFGMPCDIAGLATLCSAKSIPLVEDATEALGSYDGNVHTGLAGVVGVFSFNGNKIVTCGGGGAIVTRDAALAKRGKHITTTAKIPHRWEYRHDELGFNYRMPNLNAALACAQLERLDEFVSCKRAIADQYERHFRNTPWRFFHEQAPRRSNYWLNAVFLRDRAERDQFLAATNDAGVMTRPAWTPLFELPMYANCQRDDMRITRDVAQRLVNLPSSPIGILGEL